MRKSMNSWRKARKVLMLMHPSTIPKICHWGGMESLSPIGCINYMDLELNINAKYVAIIAIGGGEHSKCTSNNGGIPTV
jgi:hypothetical protein